jgi:biopolymer transport protein ExbB
VIKALKAGDIEAARKLVVKTHGEVGKVLKTVLTTN